jgi:hypothetical protein
VNLLELPSLEMWLRAAHFALWCLDSVIGSLLVLSLLAYLVHLRRMGREGSARRSLAGDQR